jgi:hypothetical protein
VARTATVLWTISPELVAAIDEHLGAPVDCYVNGAHTWFEDAGPDAVTLEFRLHPVARYVTPRGASHYDVWEGVVDQLAGTGDPHALRLGEEVRPLTGLWDGLECYAAYGDVLEPAELAALAGDLLGRAPDRVGMVDHELIGDAWERARGGVSIVALLLEELSR